MCNRRLWRNGALIFLLFCAAPSTLAYEAGVFSDPPKQAGRHQGPAPVWAKALQAYTYPITLLEKIGVPLAFFSPTGMAGFGMFAIPVGFLLSVVILAIGRPWMKFAWFYLVTVEISVVILVSRGYLQ